MVKEQTSEQLVLTFLTEAGEEFTSGEVLSGKLGLTSAAVFKHVEKLRSKGYKIEASRSRGYRLVELPDRVSALELSPLLNTRDLGRTVFYKDVMPSTSEAAFQQGVEGAAHGHLVLTEAQTRGKGRRGREWLSPSGVNLYLSLVLRPELPPSRAPELTLVAAVAACETLRDAGVEATIKWPNDLEIDGRKVAGILTELSAEKDVVNFVILGIGVNLNITAEGFPEELRAHATSVSLARQQPVPRALFCAALLARLEEWLDLHEDEGFAPVRERWGELSSTLNSRVMVRFDDREIEGLATGLDEGGALLVKTATGVERVIAGDVQHLRPAKRPVER